MNKHDVGVERIKLPLMEWIKLVGVVLTPVAAGAWYLSATLEKVDDNSQNIARVTQSVEKLSGAIEDLVRHDERLANLERQLASLTDGVSKLDNQVDSIQFEQANRTSSVARIATLEKEISALKAKMNGS